MLHLSYNFFFRKDLKKKKKGGIVFSILGFTHCTLKMAIKNFHHLFIILSFSVSAID